MTNARQEIPSEDIRDWEHLSDRIALGEPLSPEDRDRYDALRDRHPSLGAEDRIWARAMEDLERGTAGTRSAAELQRAVLEADGRTAAPWGWLAAAAGVVLVGGGVWLALGHDDGETAPEVATQTGARTPVPGPPPVEDASPPRSSAGALAWGDATGTWTRSADGTARLAATDGCFSLQRGASELIRVCAHAGTELRMRGLQETGSAILLRTGEVTAQVFHDRLPAGHRFSIQTRTGRVTAVGTVFSVRADTDGVLARVEEGTIEVVPREGRPRTLSAPASDWLERTETGPAPAPSSTRDTSPAPPSAAELPRSAQDARRAGKFREAARHYAILLRVHPDTTAARAATVALADLRLDHLKDPAGALDLYDQYLRRGGPLAEEAAYGRIRALERLGRARARKQAIEEFLRRHPTSFHADKLREG